MASDVAHAGAAEPNGPVAQSIQIGFGALRLAMLCLAVYWVVSNIRTVPPDTQVVTLRFGEVVNVQPAGLVLAWPRPFEQVELLPSPERQLDLRIVAAMPAGSAIIDPASRASGEVTPATAGIFLTGDGGVILLDAALTYRITDAAAYYLARAHVEPALRRLFLSSAVAVAARRDIDAFMVVRSEPGPGPRSVSAPRDTALQAQRQAERQALRGTLVQEVNRRLRVLAQRNASLGIEVTRADVTAFLPPAAKFAFDAVLEAAQMADQGLAGARTDAARASQGADHERDRILTEARASADERIGTARAHVAAITALEQRMDPASRPSLIDQVFRERIAGILKQAGSVSTIDSRGGSRMLLPAGQP